MHFQLAMAGGIFKGDDSPLNRRSEDRIRAGEIL